MGWGSRCAIPRYSQTVRQDCGEVQGQATGEGQSVYSLLRGVPVHQLILRKATATKCRWAENSIQRSDTGAEEVGFTCILITFSQVKCSFFSAAAFATNPFTYTARANSKCQSWSILRSSRHQASLLLYRRSQDSETTPERDWIHLAAAAHFRTTLVVRCHSTDDLRTNRIHCQKASTIHPPFTKRRSERWNTFPTMDLPHTDNHNRPLHTPCRVQAKGRV